MTTFDAPGSVKGTSPTGINDAGAITGSYADARSVEHGFLRAPDGTFTTFDAPGAGTAFQQGTTVRSINSAGAITGYYYDANYVHHGFVRAPDGTITSFDAPGAGTGLDQGTFAFSINTAGKVTGAYSDAGYLVHGYVRAPDGTFTTIDAGTNGIVALSINDAGAITGYVGGFPNHGFLQAPDGTFTTFDAPGVDVGQQSTDPMSINGRGEVTGNYQDSSATVHGFLRRP